MLAPGSGYVVVGHGTVADGGGVREAFLKSRKRDVGVQDWG